MLQISAVVGIYVHVQFQCTGLHEIAPAYALYWYVRPISAARIARLELLGERPKAKHALVVPMPVSCGMTSAHRDCRG